MGLGSGKTHVSLSLALMVLVGLSGTAFGDDRTIGEPSLVGYVGDEIVVVLKEDYVSGLSSESPSADQAFGHRQDFQALSRRFDVPNVTKQFQGTSHGASASTTERALARHFKVKFNSGTLDQIVAAYSSNPAVDHVERIGIHTVSATPNDPFFQGSPSPTFPYDQWNYWGAFGMGASQAWDTETGDSSVVVGILDSGVRYFHLDLGGWNALWGPDNPATGGNIWRNPGEIANDGIDNDGNGFVDDTIGWDFVASAGGFGVNCVDQDCTGPDNDPDDGDGHGTHVAGTVGGITNNANQVAGVAGGYSDGTVSGAGNGVKILPLRIGYRAQYRGFITGVVRMDWAAEAMNYVADQIDSGVNVTAINCSWGSSNSGGLGAAVDNLLAHDVVIVVAAGNSNSTSADYLDGRGDCFNIAATDISGAGASFTNHGSWVDVAAPGVDIVSTYANPADSNLNNHYIAVTSGTSMSTPHVAGIVALLESADSTLSGPAKQALITNNTVPYNDSRNLGSGIANAQLALGAIGPPNTSPMANDDGPFAVAEDSTATTFDVLFNDNDGDSDPLTVTGVTAASNGVTAITGGGTGVSYEPNPDFYGADSFDYTIGDGNGGSDTAMVTIDVTGAQDAPVADDQPVSTAQDTPVAITLTGSDADGDLLAFSVTSGPSHGGLSGTEPNVTYTPIGGYSGPDAFDFEVDDGNGGTDTATVSIDVTAPNDPPTAAFIFGTNDLTADFTDQSSDSDGNIVSWDWDFGDGNGSSGQNPSHAYAAGGTYSVTLTVQDDSGDSDSISHDVTVVAPPITASVHVDSISMSLKKKGSNYDAQGTVIIRDDGNALAADATVTGQWTMNGGALGSPVSAVTSGKGKVNLKSLRVGASSGDVFELTIIDVQKAAHFYDDKQNVETSDSIAVP